MLPYLQYALPQHCLTKIVGKLANSTNVTFKNWLIKRFIARYQVDLRDALQNNISAYPTFNDFFIRKLKPEARPIAQNREAIASPVDGTISQLGTMDRQQLLQAKKFHYNLSTLLANDLALTQAFENGSFMTCYLAPKDYHRVHMPLPGELQQTIFVPGQLFSVNALTNQFIPNLYTRNERFISIFKHDSYGLMAVIMVGALIVGSITPSWLNHPVREDSIRITQYVRDSKKDPTANNIYLEKGSELGYFSLGSTVIILMQQESAHWLTSLKPSDRIKFGQIIGTLQQK